MALSILQGVVGGFLGGIVMLPAINMSELPMKLVAKNTGKDPEDAKMEGMASHFLYSIVMGVIFVLGSRVLHIDGLLGLSGYWTNGLLFGLVLLFVAMMMVMPMAGITAEMRQKMPMSRKMGIAISHILYGLVLAATVVWLPLI